MVLKVVASSPISVRLFNLTRCEKSPRAMARLEAVRTSSGLVMHARGKNTDANTQQNGHQRQQPGAALHLEYPAVGLVPRLLHDHGPVQITHRAISAEHFRALLALGDAEFAGGRDQLGLAALLQEVAYDLRVGQVLAGGVVGSGAGNQAALAVDDVRRQPAAVHFLQTAYQELQVLDRANHSQESVRHTSPGC